MLINASKYIEECEKRYGIRMQPFWIYHDFQKCEEYHPKSIGK